VLPLEAVFMDIEHDPDMFMDAITGRAAGRREWPPPRYQERDYRLALYAELWDGNLMQLVAPGDRIPRRFPNLFRRLPDIIAKLLLTSDLATGLGPDADRCARPPVPRATGLMLRTGGCWMSAVEGQCRVHNPAYTYPLRDAGIVETVPVPDWPDPTMLRVTTADTAGAHTVWYQAYSGDSRSGRTVHAPWIGTLGDMLTEPVTASGSPPVKMLNSPEASGWGTSMFDDLAALVCELAESHDRASSILAVHERPLLTYRIADIDVTDSVLPQLETPAGAFATDAAALGSGEGLETEEQLIRHTLRRLRVADALRLPDGVSGLDYVTWDGGLAANAGNVEQIHEEIRLMTGLPSLLTSASGQLPSGESLKRQLLVLYASTAQLHQTLTDGLNETLGVTVDWPHPFDAFDPETSWAAMFDGGPPGPQREET